MSSIKEPQPIESLLNFDITQNPEVVLRRATVEYHPQRERYAPSETIIIDWNTNESHIFGAHCRLEGRFTFFSIDNATIGIDDLGHNLAAVMFKDIRLSASGFEIVNELQVGHRIDGCDIMSCDRDYFNTEGESMGYHEDRLGNGNNSRFNSNGFAQDFSIPMHHIMGFFSQTNLIPTGLMKKGLRFEFKLKSLNDMLVWVNLPVTGTINIDNIRFVTDQYTLSPNINKAIKQAEKTTGINYTFDTWTSRIFRSPSKGNQTFQMSEFVGRALGFMFRLSRDGILNEPRTDALRTEIYSDGILDWRVKLGKLYYPANFNVNNVVYSYNETLKSYNNLANCERPPAINLVDYNGNRHVIAVDFERSVIDEDGSSATSTLLNSNIELDINLGDPLGDVWVIFTYLHYQKAIKLLNGQILDSR